MIMSVFNTGDEVLYINLNYDPPSINGIVQSIPTIRKQAWCLLD